MSAIDLTQKKKLKALGNVIPNTSKLVSVPQPQVQQGPTTRRTVWRSASWMENLGRKGCQVCRMWPMVVPGGAWTSIWRRRQTGHHQGHKDPGIAHQANATNCLSRPSPSHFPTPLPFPPKQRALALCLSTSSIHPSLPSPAYLLEATWAAAAAAAERTEQTQHLPVPGIHYAETQRPFGATAQAGTAVALLGSLAQGLPSPRAQFIAVARFPA